MNEKYWTGTPEERAREVARVGDIVIRHTLDSSQEWDPVALSDALVPPLPPEPPCVEWNGWRVTWDGGQYKAKRQGEANRYTYKSAASTVVFLCVPDEERDTLVTRLLALKGGEVACEYRSVGRAVMYRDGSFTSALAGCKLSDDATELFERVEVGHGE